MIENALLINSDFAELCNLSDSQISPITSLVGYDLGLSDANPSHFNLKREMVELLIINKLN